MARQNNSKKIAKVVSPIKKIKINFPLEESYRRDLSSLINAKLKTGLLSLIKTYRKGIKKEDTHFYLLYDYYQDVPKPYLIGGIIPTSRQIVFFGKFPRENKIKEALSPLEEMGYKISPTFGNIAEIMRELI